MIDALIFIFEKRRENDHLITGNPPKEQSKNQLKL